MCGLQLTVNWNNSDHSAACFGMSFCIK